MLASAFAFSSSAKMLLTIVTCTVEFLLMFFIAELVLALFHVDASIKQKAAFAFLAGTVLQCGWTYTIYFIKGTADFRPVEFLLITTPNPIAAMIYCWLALKILGLPPIRSVKLMSYIYLFWSLNKNLSTIFTAFFFQQTHIRWNYLLDIYGQISHLITFWLIYAIMMHLISHNKINVVFAKTRFFHLKKELVFYFFKALFIYSVSILFPLIIEHSQLANIISFGVNLLFFALIICIDLISYQHRVNENSMMHISILSGGLAASREIKHDYYNILQTYTGYIELGKIESLKKYHYSLLENTSNVGTLIDLSHRAHENPALVSVLKDKLEYAAQFGVKVYYSLQCDLSDFYIDNIDMCQMLACLLDHAVENVKDLSEKKIHLSIKNKSANAKLLILSHRTDHAAENCSTDYIDMPVKQYHDGMGLGIVQHMINQYGNFMFQIRYCNAEIWEYLEVHGE